MQYRLLGPHIYHDSVRLEEGTIVGDDTPYPWKYRHNDEPMPPSNQMEGVDDEAKKKVEELHQSLYGEAAEFGPSKEVQEARKKEEEDNKKAEEGSEPVSRQQKYERKVQEELDEKAEKAGGEEPFRPGIPPGPTAPPAPAVPAPPAPHITGQQAQRGVATPKVDPEKKRPTEPNKEQYPKD